MIDLYYWTTPNGHKVTIFLEETGLPYRIIPVDIGKGDQFKPQFLAIAPNNRIPAIIDTAPADGGTALSVFESGAILQYFSGEDRPIPACGYSQPRRGHAVAVLADGGSRPHGRTEPPFRAIRAGEDPVRGDALCVKETNRLYGVLDKRLADREFVAGAYSIADMAAYPWIVPHEQQQQNLVEFPHLKRWFEAIRARRAVQRGYEVAASINQTPVVTEQSRALLFCQTARTAG